MDGGDEVDSSSSRSSSSSAPLCDAPPEAETGFRCENSSIDENDIRRRILFPEGAGAAAAPCWWIGCSLKK